MSLGLEGGGGKLSRWGEREGEGVRRREGMNEQGGRSGRVGGREVRRTGWRRWGIGGWAIGGGKATYQRRPPERGEVARKGPNIV